MREIKFRAWDEDTGTMIDVTQMQYDNWGDVDLVLGYAKEDKEPKSFRHTSALRLMQFTGLKDKNGVEVYEKDITEEGSYTDWCEWCIGYQQFGMMEEGAFCHNCDGDYSLSDLVSDLPFDLEIIGNIYENPELIIN